MSVIRAWFGGWSRALCCYHIVVIISEYLLQIYNILHHVISLYTVCNQSLVWRTDKNSMLPTQPHPTLWCFDYKLRPSWS